MARSTYGMKGKENQDLACCSCAQLAAVKMILGVANICPTTTLELTGQLFSQKTPQMEGPLFSDLKKPLCFMLTFHEGEEQRAAHGLH